MNAKSAAFNKALSCQIGEHWTARKYGIYKMDVLSFKSILEGMGIVINSTSVSRSIYEGIKDEYLTIDAKTFGLIKRNYSIYAPFKVNEPVNETFMGLKVIVDNSKKGITHIKNGETTTYEIYERH
jgi:hypothetical protein